jgi:hypothetical protein
MREVNPEKTTGDCMRYKARLSRQLRVILAPAQTREMPPSCISKLVRCSDKVALSSCLERGPGYTASVSTIMNDTINQQHRLCRSFGVRCDPFAASSGYVCSQKHLRVSKSVYKADLLGGLAHYSQASSGQPTEKAQRSWQMRGIDTVLVGAIVVSGIMALTACSRFDSQFSYFQAVLHNHHVLFGVSFLGPAA